MENNIQSVEGERFGAYCDGMPIWGKLRALSEQFLRWNASSIVDCKNIRNTHINNKRYEVGKSRDRFGDNRRVRQKMLS